MPDHAQVWTRHALEAPHLDQDKARRVRRMFDAIAPRYELVNSVFSLGRDAFWRRRAVELALVRPHEDVLDIACGTGDFARVFARAGPRSVVGCDFAHHMLIRASAGCGAHSAKDATRRQKQVLQWCEADALRLPFGPASFSIVSCAFGVRNFQELEFGLTEMFRVLRPGGRAVILEFSRPSNRLFRAAYEFYSSRVMPLGASWLSGDRSGAYRYLPRSVVSFLTAEQMCARLQRVGFGSTTATPLTFGVVTVYMARKN